MELFIKLYTDKLSRIGIKFPSEYQATRSYESMISKYRGESFLMSLEPLRNKINLTLQSVQSGAKVPYKELEYKKDHLHKLLSSVDKNNLFQFVHVFSSANNLLIAKPYKSNEFFTISNIELIGKEQF